LEVQAYQSHFEHSYATFRANRTTRRKQPHYFLFDDVFDFIAWRNQKLAVFYDDAGNVIETHEHKGDCQNFA